MRVAERRWRAMGGEAHLILIDADERLAEFAISRVASLEARWSRFVATSDVQRLARSGGRPTRVSVDTVLALQCAISGWAATAGRFDPTVGAAMTALGYDRSFEEIGSDPALAAGATHAAPGLADITIDDDRRVVTVPDGVHLDFGAFGKGLAADIVAAELREAGVAGACVNLGGDLRVTGRPPGTEAWVVAVEYPEQPGSELTRLALTEGGVATSAPTGRTWRRGDDVMRHVLDPASGAPVETAGAITVVAGECWWAEVLATAATVAGPADGGPLVTALGGEFLHVLPSGAAAASAGMHAYLAGDPLRLEEAR